jgi:hypothetical protein
MTLSAAGTCTAGASTDVEHGCLLKSMELETAVTGFHVTRLTQASFIVSTPKPVEPKLLRSVDPVDTRRAAQRVGPTSGQMRRPRRNFKIPWHAIDSANSAEKALIDA